MHWDHEPARSGAPASRTAPGVIGAENRPCRRPAFRFTECPLGLTPGHWDHEPNEWSSELLFGLMVARRTENAVPNWSSALRFMETACSHRAQTVLINHLDPNAALGQQDCSDHTHRTCTGHQHFGCLFSRHTSYSARPRRNRHQSARMAHAGFCVGYEDL
jgi:hypothetical protein